MSTGKVDGRVELLQGTLDLLVLRTLRLGPAHGHAIMKAVSQSSDGVLQVEQGSPSKRRNGKSSRGRSPAC
jgi:hypothetical protein